MNNYTFAAAFAGTIDTQARTIAGVSVITEGDALGHGVKIDAMSLASVKTCAEEYAGGLKVKMDHGSGFGDIVGTLRNFRIDLAGENYMGDPTGQLQCLRADLQLLKTHPATPTILEMAELMPDTFGLSISFSGSVDDQGADGMFVRCLEIYSCDLVDQPAANPNGLFSAAVDKSGMVNMSDQPTAEANASALAAINLRLSAAQAQAQKNFSDYQEQFAKVTDLGNQVETLAAEKLDLSNKLSALAESNLRLTTDLAAAQELSAQKVNTEAARIVASAGHPPIALGAGGSHSVNTISRAEFDALPHDKRSAFLKSGGKLTS